MPCSRSGSVNTLQYNCLWGQTGSVFLASRLFSMFLWPSLRSPLTHLLYSSWVAFWVFYTETVFIILSLLSCVGTLDFWMWQLPLFGVLPHFWWSTSCNSFMEMVHEKYIFWGSVNLKLSLFYHPQLIDSLAECKILGWKSFPSEFWSHYPSILLAWMLLLRILVPFLLLFICFIICLLLYVIRFLFGSF